MTLRRAGRMHHLGIGTTHARKRVLAFADDHHVTVAELATGEVLSTHLIEPRQDLLAQPKRRARPLAELPKTETYDATHVRHMSRLITQCRRRDSNPRHADYDSAALTD